MAQQVPDRRSALRAAYSYDAKSSSNRRGSVREIMARGSRSMGKALALSLSMDRSPTEEVQVLLLAHKQTPKRQATVRLTIRKGRLMNPIQELHTHVRNVYGWKRCNIETQDCTFISTTQQDMEEAWDAYQIAEAARRRDVLEAVLESTRGALSSDDTELHYQGCHALWELACDQANHRHMTYSLFEQLIKLLQSPELRVRSLAGAAIWKLAENERTVKLLPTDQYVPRLFAALFSIQQAEPDEATTTKVSEMCAAAALRRGTVMFCERISSSSRRGKIGRRNTNEEDEEEDEDEAAHREDYQAARAVAGTGYPLIEQRVWQAGALLACLADESGRRAFHKTGVALRLLPLLEARDSPTQLKAACALLLSQAASVATPVCKALLDGGAASLVRLAGGFIGGIDIGTRLQAADLLKFCIARVRLSSARSGDRPLLDALPRLFGELRAAMKPLVFAMHKFIEQGDKAGDPKVAEQSVHLLRNIVGALWGFASAIRNANTSQAVDECDTSPRLPATPSIVTYLRKLLELAPERERFINERQAKLSKLCGKSMRNFVLGLLATLGFSSIHPPTEQAEAWRKEEEEAYEDANARLSTLETEALDENELAATRIQSIRRAQQAKREVDDIEEAAYAQRPSRRYSVAPRRSQNLTRGSQNLTSRSSARPGSIGIDGTTLAELAADTEEVYGQIQGRQLRMLRVFIPELLGYLERSVKQGQAATRVNECYSAALSTLAPMAVTALLSADAIARVIKLLDTVLDESESEDKLVGYAQRIHCHLMSTLLSLVSHLHPGISFTPPSVAAAIAAGTGEAPGQDDDEGYEKQSGMRLPKRQLEKVVTHMQLSTMAGKIGAVILWLQASAGEGEMIGELGGTLALCQMLNNAVNDHQLEGAHGQQATWICAAMWRLSFTPSNAEICLENATPALLAATQQTESAPLSAAALGCVNVAMSGGSKGLFERLEKLGVASALRSLASSAHFRESDRVTAALTIGNLNKKPEELGSTSRSGSPIGRRLGSPGSPVRSNATTETKRVSVLASEFEKKPKKEPEGEPLDDLMVSLTKDQSASLRAVGCRGVARAAQRGIEACAYLVTLEAPKHVMSALKGAAKLALEQAIAKDAEAEYANDVEDTPAESQTGLNSQLVRAFTKPRKQKREYELLYDATNAALNMSGAKVAQVPIARGGLWSLVELWYASQKFAWTGELLSVGEMASDTLTNLASNAANRNLMYQAELKLKTAAWSERSPFSVGATSLSANSIATDASDSKDEGAMDPAAASAPAPDETEEPPPPPPPPPPVKESPTKESTPSKDPRKRYLDWLDEIGPPPGATVEDETNISVNEEEGDEPQRVLLARAAFSLMDANEDGELSRLEMVRAFRLDERVRELLLPLLPLPATSRNTVTGDNLQEQIEAFEALFKMMDADGSDGVTRYEFEVFFRLMDMNKKTRTFHGAAARKRLMAAKPDADKQAATVAVSSLSMRGGSPRWPNPLAGGPKPASPRGTTKPPLDGLMRKNYFDTWRKPMSEQMPKPTGPAIGLRPSTASRPLSSAGSTASLLPSRSGALGDEGRPATRGDASRPTTRGDSSRPATRGSTVSTTTVTPIAAGKGTMRATSSMPNLIKPATPASSEGGTGLSRFKLAAQKMGLRDSGDVSHTTPGIAGKKPPVAGSPWKPKVSTIEIAQPLPSKADRMSLKPFEKAYLAATESDRLRYKIDLPPEEEYTKSYKFTGQNLAKTEEAKGRDALISWVGVSGSRVGDSVAPAFPLPDGRVLRLFHTSRKRNARTPYPEPAENLPESVSGLGMDRLPERPAPPYPTEKDVPKIAQTVDLVAPVPSKSLLDHTNPPPSFGEIVGEPFVVQVSEHVEKKLDEEAEEGAIAEGEEGEELEEDEEEEPFVLERSIFEPRKRHSDGHTFYQTPQIMLRAFQVDWARCNSPHFRALVASEDDEGYLAAGVEVAEIRDALFEFHQVIYTTYTFYCALGDSMDAADGYAMDQKVYFNFLRDIGLVNEDSKHCNAQALEAIFQNANFEQDALTFEQKEINRLNYATALMRFEFMHVLVRIAISKYVHDATVETHDVSDAVHQLMNVDIIPNLPPEAKRDPNVFRRKRFYKREVAELFEENLPALKTVFEYYAAVEGDELALSQKTQEPTLTLFEFETFLRDCNLFIDENVDQTKVPVGLSPLRARLIFMWSQSFISDELKRRKKMTTATFTDFLEMLGRMCTFMDMPTQEMLVKIEAKSANDFFEQKMEGKKAFTDMEAYNSLGGEGDYDWQEEESSDKPLVDELRMLLSLVFDRLDESGDGKVDRQDLAVRRRKMHDKQKKILACRAANIPPHILENMLKAGAMDEE